MLIDPDLVCTGTTLVVGRPASRTVYARANHEHWHKCQ